MHFQGNIFRFMLLCAALCAGKSFATSPPTIFTHTCSGGQNFPYWVGVNLGTSPGYYGSAILSVALSNLTESISLTGRPLPYRNDIAFEGRSTKTQADFQVIFSVTPQGQAYVTIYQMFSNGYYHQFNMLTSLFCQ